MPVLLDMAVSLDGIVGGPDGEDVGLYDWYFDPSPVSRPVIDELVETSGALVLGRGAFGTGDDAGGWDETPYLVPHFVVTHRELPPAPPDRTVEFVAVSGVEQAVEQARRVAGERCTTIGGGPDIARQCLDAGLVDEVQLHVVPRVVGAGLRLFDGSSRRLQLRPTRVVDAPAVTHLRYAVERS